MSREALERVLSKARDTLRSGDLGSEAAVRLAVIVPVLTALGWDPADPKQWVPEMPVPSGRVDDALKSDTGTPLVFVEAKKHGNLSAKAEEQLFDYAAKQGVPMLVLTDGDTWDLYLAMAAGEPHERRFAHVELTQSSDMAAIADDLARFLQRSAVVSQQANFAAQQRLAEVNDRLKGKRGLASGWSSLLQDGDDRLRELLIERVEDRTGSRPWAEDVDEFLSELADRLDVPTAPPSQNADPVSRDQTPPRPSAGQDSAVAAGRIVGVVIRGNRHEVGNGQAAMALLAGALQQQNSEFLERYRDQAAPGAHKRPPAVRDDALNDYLKDQIRGHSYRRVDGFPEWWIYVDLKTVRQTERLRIMARIACLPWGVDEGVRLIRRVVG